MQHGFSGVAFVHRHALYDIWLLFMLAVPLTISHSASQCLAFCCEPITQGQASWFDVQQIDSDSANTTLSLATSNNNSNSNAQSLSLGGGHTAMSICLRMRRAELGASSTVDHSERKRDEVWMTDPLMDTFRHTCV